MNHTVLLVDDEEFLRRLLSRMLAEAGLGVIEAENGQAALLAAQSQDGNLRLVVTDIHMPVMDGLEFAVAFRRQHPGVPILFITGREPYDGSLAALPAGNLLRKPFTSDVFLDTVSRLLDRAAALE